MVCRFPSIFGQWLYLRMHICYVFVTYFFRIGPFKVLLSAPVGLDEVINYADFKQETTMESVDDESTLEEEPNEQDLQALIAGNITVKQAQIIILESGMGIGQ